MLLQFLSVRTHRWAVFCIAACCLAPVVGCGGKAKESEADNGEEIGELKKVSAAKLPKLADPLPPLDGGRIEFSPPAGWKQMPREDAKYVAAFVKSDPLGVPRLLLKTEASSLEGLDTATTDNVEEFAKLVAAELKSNKTELVEPVRPMIIGDNAYARYVVRKKLGSKPLDVQILRGLWKGRTYTIELQVGKGEIPESRDLAYAVAAALKSLDSAPVAPAPDKPAAEGASGGTP